MGGTIRDHYEAFPDPAPELVPISPVQVDLVDDAFHFGWSWHRYRYAYRPADAIRILDAGCGTGLSTLALAKLNPGAEVVGVDFSERSLELAGDRKTATPAATVSFQNHDLTRALPKELGRFDFVVARRLMANTDEPAAVLKTLTDALALNGLLEVDFPSAAGRMPARQLMRGVDALVSPNAPAAERAEVGLELLGSLRPDHPIRRFDATRHGSTLPSITQFAATYLSDRGRDGTLERAIETLIAAGLRCLYVADRGGWRPERVFGSEISPRIRERVSALEMASLEQLKDALDISLHPDSYLLYACHAAFEPHIPDWPETSDFDALRPLIPHRTHLAKPVGEPVASSPQRVTVPYRSVNGVLGDLHIDSHSIVDLVDGRRTIDDIEARLGSPESPEARRARWLDLAGLGFLLLQSPDIRQNVDCVHLGAIKDRLDCGCPRRWVRACDRHGLCTISTVGPEDSKSVVLGQALQRLGVESAVACDRCPDYDPEE